MATEIHKPADSAVSEAGSLTPDLGVCDKCGWPLQSCDCCGLCGEPKCDCVKELNGDTSEPLGMDADREMFGDDADHGIELGNK